MSLSYTGVRGVRIVSGHDAAVLEERKVTSILVLCDAGERDGSVR